jgi:Family of unknown function (DUF5681)
MRDDETAQSPDYEIGYGKPPKSGQFVKGGKPGNPFGRPKKNYWPKLAEAAYEPTQDMMLREGYRIVTVREGDKRSKMPAMQAVSRNLWQSAMKGNRQAQRMVLSFMKATERESRVLHLELYAMAVEHKSRCQKEFALSDAAGVPRSEPTPHPDDIAVDARTGAVRFVGPVNAEEMIELREIIRTRDVAQQIINDVVGRPGRMRHRKSIRLKAQIGYDAINESLPKRYRKALENRLELG